MIDPLSALSLYRQLEGLENALEGVKGSAVDEFRAALETQGSFNHILNQIRGQCADALKYLESIKHIEPVNFPKGIDPSAYPHFLTHVKMLKQALRALLELGLSSDEKRKIGFT